jgi:TP901 family phage tail tape measure protein
MANAGYQLGNNYKVLNTLISEFNELANKYPIEVDTLAQAWQNSANIAKQANLSIEDYNALITVAGSVTQKSGDEIGNGLKTVLMRLQGVTDGAETLEEDVSKVDKVLSGLGIQIKKTPTEFRPAMDALTEIAAKYKELGDTGQTVKQAEMLETLAGKYRANILAGILNNFDQINQAIKDQANSYQSAENENARYMSSIQAKTKALQAQWELFASRTLNSDLIKGIVDIGKALVQFLDNDIVRFISGIGILTGSLLGLKAIFTGISKSTLGTAIGVFALDVAEKGLIATTKTLTATLLASPLFWVVAGATVIYGIVQAVDALTVTVEEQREKVNELSEAYNSLKSDLSGLQNELKTTNDRIDELNSKDTLTLVEQDELQKLQITNRELQTRIDLLAKEAEFKAKDLGKAAIELYNKEFGNQEVSNKNINDYLNNAQLNTGTSMPIANTSNIGMLIASYKELVKLQKESTDTKGIEAYSQILKQSLGNIDELISGTNDLNALVGAYQFFIDLRDKTTNSEDYEYYSKIITGIEKQLTSSSKDLIDIREKLRALPQPTQEEKKVIDEINNALKYTRSILTPDELFGEAWGQLTDEEQKKIETSAKDNTITEEQIKK